MACFAAPLIQRAGAHGSVEYPRSRAMHVWDGLKQSPRPAWTVQAVAKDNETSYYTWAQISRNFPAALNESAQSYNTYIAGIPDGRLASAGILPNPAAPSSLSYSGLDTISTEWDWPVTQISAGPLAIRWNATATHSPSFFRVWLTKTGFDYRLPLKWADLEYLGHPAVTQSGNIYTFNVNLPERTGRHVLYVAWQRVDPAGEVFFSTSDVSFGNNPEPLKPSLSFSPSTLSVNENAGSVVVTATLSAAAPAGGVTAKYATAPGTAGAADFTATSGTLTFAAGEKQKQISIPITDDTLQETDEAFTVSLTNITGAIAGQTFATVTIKDNDTPPTPSTGAYNFTIYQNWGTGWRAYLDVTNGGTTNWTNWMLAFDGPWSITSISDGKVVAHVGTKYTITTAGWNSVIPPGGTIRLEFGANTSDITPPTNVRINGQLIGSGVPGLSIASLSVTEGNGPRSAVLTVSLESAHTAAIQVAYATANGTAIAGTDYTAASGTLTFAPGETSKTITIAFTGNTVQQPNRAFTVSLAGVPGQTAPRFVTGGQTATVTIMDDDTPVPVAGIPLVLTGDIVIEGNSGTKNAVFTFKLGRAVKTGETVSVKYATSNLTANSGTDYTAVSGLLTFAAGASRATVNVPVKGDTVDETLELFQLTLSNAMGCEPLNNSAVCQIVDDELTPHGFGNQRIVAYIDATTGQLSLPPANRLTHIMAAFANVAAEGNLIFPVSIDFNALNALKMQNPSLKILLSVGGWEWSERFTAVANNATKRAAFAASCKARVKEFNLDGIDLDWEWPGGGNTVPNANDRNNFTALVHETRLALNSLTATTGKSYELTCYAPATAGNIGFWDLAALKKDFDFFNVQGYDLHGTWESKTGHQSGLRRNPAGPDDRLNQEQILAIYTAAGVPKSQLLLGAPFYGQVWTSLSATSNGLFQNANPYGQITYSNLASGPATPVREYLRTWDEHAKVPWLYDALGTKRFVSYDDPQAIYEKALYSRDNGYAGVYFWQMGGDTADRQLLMTLSDTMATTHSAFAAAMSPDIDGDGIPDAWERQNFGDLETASASSDYDGDGASDLLEWASRTDPRNSFLFLEVGVHGAGSAEPMVAFDSEEGVSYRIERSTDLLTWTALVTLPGTGGHLHYPDTTLPAGSLKVFYRVAPIP